MRIRGWLMDKPKIYLETTMFSFYYEERTAPLYLEQKTLVRRIFELIDTGVYEPYTSPYATKEISNEPDKNKREKKCRPLFRITALLFFLSPKK